MDFSKFCPVCGEETDNLYGQKNLCRTCYLKKEFLPRVLDNIKPTICRECGRFRVDGELIEPEDSESMLGIVIKQEAGDLEAQEKLLQDIQVEVERPQITLSDSRSEVSRTGEFSVENIICRYCKGAESDSARTKIQVRGKDKADSVAELVEKRAQNIEQQNHDDFLLDSTETSNGKDYLLSTEHMSRHILQTVKKEFDVDTERSYRQIGEENGKKKYLNTVVVRTA